ncbi:MAG: Rrf2 family transcriptional regulator [Chitinophagales bacterium]|nr:Rrf2 family transcriptional regulator [Chitinophagales bacterium]
MISKKSKYAIKALLYLARNKEQKRTLIEEIATKENIPKKFLEAILLELKNAGILGSKKGRGGGYYLIKTVSQINMADILRLYDGPIALVPCAAYKYYQPCEEKMYLMKKPASAVLLKTYVISPLLFLRKILSKNCLSAKGSLLIARKKFLQTTGNNLRCLIVYNFPCICF